MEKLQITKGQVLNQLQKSSTDTTLEKISKHDGKYYVSKYVGLVDRETISICMAKIKMTFPALETGFFEMLAERVSDKGFSNQQLIDAVNHVIDTCIYHQPTLAQFLGYDKKIRLYNYREMVELTHESGGDDIFKYYEKRVLNNIPHWYKKE